MYINWMVASLNMHAKLNCKDYRISLSGKTLFLMSGWVNAYPMMLLLLATNARHRLIVTRIAPMMPVIYFLSNALPAKFNMKDAVLRNAGILKICRKKSGKKKERFARLMGPIFP